MVTFYLIVTKSMVCTANKFCKCKKEAMNCAASPQNLKAMFERNNASGDGGRIGSAFFRREKKTKSRTGIGIPFQKLSV